MLSPLLDIVPPAPETMEEIAASRANMFSFPIDENIIEQTDCWMKEIIDSEGRSINLIGYAPKNRTGSLPCILHMHGGGFIMGEAATYEFAHRPLVLELQCMLVSVNYRLAPETIFPGSVEDCYTALGWIYAHGDELDIDLSRVGVMGESAGGGLAAALALLARDRGEYAVAFQHLIYPMLDDRTCLTSAEDSFVGEFVWTRANNRLGWTSLLGHAPNANLETSPYAAPSRARDLSGLPPAYIATGAIDLFVEEDIDYARRLIIGGVPTELHVYPGAFHGFDLVPDAEVAIAARRDSMAALAKALG